MLSTSTTTQSPAAKRLEAMCEQFKDSNSFNMSLIERKFKEIDNENDPIAAMILMRELYINLEMCTLGIVQLIRTSVPKEFTEVTAEYIQVQALAERVIQFPMTICKIVNINKYSIAFPTDYYGQTEAENILKKNIFTRFVDLDKLGTGLFGTSMGTSKDEIQQLCHKMYLKKLEDVLFIQSELLSILKDQKNYNSRIDTHIKKSKAGIVAQHYYELYKYLDDHEHNITIHPELIGRIQSSTTASNSKERAEFCELLRLLIACEIYTLDSYHNFYKSKTNIDTFVYLSDDPDLAYLARFYPQVGRNKSEAETNHQKLYFAHLINHKQLQKTCDDFSMLDNEDLTNQMVIFERNILNHIITLSMMMHQIKKNVAPEELPTPHINNLINCLRKKKKQENAVQTSISSSSSSSSSESEDRTKEIVPTKEFLLFRMNAINTSIDELQQIYLHIYKNESLISIVQDNNDEQKLEAYENMIIEKLLPERVELEQAINGPKSEYTAIYSRMAGLLNVVNNQIDYLRSYVTHLRTFAGKSAKISKTDKVKLALEKKAQEKAREAKLEEQKRLEAKSEKPVKSFQRQVSATAETKPVPTAKPVKPISRPTADNNHSEQNTIRLLHLDEACKNIIYIRLLLGLQDLDKDVKHFALFYNIFRCFQSLKLYQETGGMKNTFNPDEVVNLRNMIIHHGINAVCEKSVEDFAANIVGNLPKALSDLRKNDLFRMRLTSDARQTLIQEFGLLERNIMPFVSSFNHAKLVIENTPLYTKLKNFHEAKTNNDTTTEYTNVISNSYIPLMKKIIASMDKITAQERDANIQSFIDNYLFELQALRMLAIICGELINNNHSNVNNNFDNFRHYCRHSARNMAGHAMVDMDAPLEFFNVIKRKLDKFDEKRASLTQSPAAFFTPLALDEKKPQDELSLQSLKLN